ncbi:M20/M25/M40 family metallo-hydrolase [Fulvivirga kasyanovii]|uniref:Carboxypeptidase Q n=1 Tax=Fulvivirga kasyanovii TaxID=396812 RepID=A0ABW9RLT8_9BACT|nr:M20/M25/M40 family metallo-hydrolase [Fulvivirga kasyanovii]MTI25052.1 M20/M25/M40 family metallo-hydrolase [Fulvivirga kasyanovii]
MKNRKPIMAWIVFLCLMNYSVWSQDQEMSKQESFYATVTTEDARELQKLYPGEVVIHESADGVSAVKMTVNAADHLHHNVLTHGPGYVYMPSLEKARESIKEAKAKKAAKQAQQLAINYTIDQDVYVNQSLNLVDNYEIENTTQMLVGYGTRYHTYSSATQSVVDIKAKWDNMAAGRSDISTRLVNHSSTNMPSAVLTIQGTTYPDEYVIIGGHIDSTNPRNNANAPGADDDASGIATITEAARVLIEMDFRPQRTIEIMAYAAEEVGLRGSGEIAEDYANNNVNVIGYAQFDMTNYKGSTYDVYLIEDQYTTPVLNNFMKQLMDHYNSSGTHQLTYSSTQCNYGCSDHASWESEGYNATFPFEASFSGSNPYIHTSSDTYNQAPLPNSVHAAKFAKLALEFLIETAKADGGTNPTCNVPSGLSSSSITTSSATVSWSSASGAASYGIRYRIAGGSWVSTTSSSTSKSLSGLTADTNYEFQVKSICSGQESDYSSSATFRTLSNNPVSYCSSSGNDVSYEWIANVTVGSLNNSSSSDGGYADNTSQSVSLTAGNTYSVSLTPGFMYSSYSEVWRVWIDYNHDGDFTDSGEQVYSGTSSSTSSGSFTVPSGASSVTTRMRVSMRYRNAPSSCGSFDYGEVEDYTVSINGSSLAAKGDAETAREAAGMKIFPNPANTETIALTIEDGFEDKGLVRIMTLDGKTLETKTILEPRVEVDISRLPAGHTYILVFESGDIKKTQSFIKQ